MKHKSFHRTLAVLLSVMLVICLLPTAVLAADTATVKINGQTLIDGEPLQLGEGTAVLDEESSTLTLDNTTINQDSSTSPGTPVLRADNGDLKIVLIGENTITSTTQRPVYLTSGEYTIQGTESDSLIIKTDSDGLQLEGGNLTIDGCKIDITSSSYGGMICLGVYSTGEFGILTILNGANININSFENTLMGEYGLYIRDSIVTATAISNYEDYPTSVVSSYGNMSIVNSAVAATANGEEASAISAGGTVSINNSEVSATTTSQTNAYTALSGNNIDITNHSYVTVKSAGTIGVWSPSGSVAIQDSIAYVAAHGEWPAIRGDNGGATINGSWVEAFGSEVSPELSSSDSAIFFNNEGSVSGSLTLPGNATVGKDMQLSIPEGSSVTVPDGVTFTNHGSIEVLGSIAKDGGAIVCDSHVGGTATCTSKAVCDICKNEYGDLLPHELTKTEAKEATCTEPGNIRYWTCEVCHKLFRDAEGTEEITPADTVLETIDHQLSEIAAKDPTCTEPGNIRYWACQGCGKVFSDEAGTEEIIPADTVLEAVGHSYQNGVCTACGATDPDYEIFVPEIIQGANGTWKLGGKDGLSFTSDAAFADFQRVQVDGRDLDGIHYEVREGSTIVTLKASYLETLAVGKHTLAIVSATGTAATEFTIQAAQTGTTPQKTDSTTPKTGDDSSLLLGVGMLVVAGSALGALVYTRKRKQH